MTKMQSTVSSPLREHGEHSVDLLINQLSTVRIDDLLQKKNGGKTKMEAKFDLPVGVKCVTVKKKKSERSDRDIAHNNNNNNDVTLDLCSRVEKLYVRTSKTNKPRVCNNCEKDHKDAENARTRSITLLDDLHKTEVRVKVEPPDEDDDKVFIDDDGKATKVKGEKKFILLERGPARRRDEFKTDHLSPYARQQVNRRCLSGGCIVQSKLPEPLPQEAILKPLIPITVNSPLGDDQIEELEQAIETENIAVVDQHINELTRKYSVSGSPARSSTSSVFDDDNRILATFLEMFASEVSDTRADYVIDNDLLSNTVQSVITEQYSPSILPVDCYNTHIHSQSPLSNGYADFTSTPSPNIYNEFENGTHWQHMSSNYDSVSNNSPVSLCSEASTHSYGQSSMYSPLKTPTLECSPKKSGKMDKMNTWLKKLVGQNSVDLTQDLVCCKNDSVEAKSLMNEIYSSLDQDTMNRICLKIHRMPEKEIYALLQTALKSLGIGNDQSRTNSVVSLIYIICERLLMSERKMFLKIGRALFTYAVYNCLGTPYLGQYFGECFFRAMDTPESSCSNEPYEKFDFDEPDSCGNTWIHNLAMRGDSSSEILACLLAMTWNGSKVFNVNRQNNEGYTPLHLACMNEPLRQGATPILTDSKVSYLRTIHVLIKHGQADIFIKDGKSGNSALHTAVDSRHCDYDTVLAIINNLSEDVQKKIVNCKNYSNATPLSIARAAVRSKNRPDYPRMIVEKLKKLK